MENNNEEKNNVMVSNLPLLFADGSPTSVNAMSVEDLQYFIPFLLKCMLGCDPSGWAAHPKFKWWPLDIPWSPIILTKKHQTPYWRGKLQNLVKRCYDYNGCGYLLQFSSKLQQLVGGFKFKDNWDGTTSMFDSNSGKLLVTFRNENMNYDSGLRLQNSNQRPMLLPRLNSPSSPAKLGAPASIPSLAQEAPSSAQMVEPPVSDIYLCDYCGADFSALSAIKAHESKCMADKVSENHSSNNMVEVETKDLDQVKFMWYLSLSSRKDAMPPPNLTPAKVRPVVKRACTLNDKRFTTIAFSSNLAQSFKKTSLSSTALENLISRYEKLCVAKPLSVHSDRASAIVDPANHPSGQASRLRPLVPVKRKCEWTHSYSFNRADREERLKTISTGLNKRARTLLLECENVCLKLKRLTPEEIETWTHPKPKPPQPLLQPWLQKSLANLPPSCTVSLAPRDSMEPWTRPIHGLASSLVVSRLDISKPLTMTKHDHLHHRATDKRRARSPPGLLPLITSAWSMQTMQSVKPRMNNQFLLPDLIPVPKNPKTRSLDPVVIQMPSVSSPKTSASSSLPKVSCTDVIDLCSSDEEEMNPKQKAVVSAMLAKPLVLPPGISITQVKREPVEGRSFIPSDVRPHFEHGNNHRRNLSTWLGSTSTLRSPPPALKFMGQQKPTDKRDLVRNTTALPTLSMDASLPIVTPLKLGKLPAEKREQMKQSLLKIQQKEGKTPPSSGEKVSPPASEKSGDDANDTPKKMALDPSPLSLIPLIPNKDLGKLLSEECKELQHKGLSHLFNKQRLTRRKRMNGPGLYSFEDEDESLSEAPRRKNPKLEMPILFEKCHEQLDGDSYPTIIEVDVGGPDVTISEGSRSFGSLTPDSRNSKKKSELSRLLEDECKELRRKGLEELPAVSNQRITRCRTKSLPMTANKV